MRMALAELNVVHSTTVQREKEKMELQDLNERFANYLEEVYILNFFNKKLTADVEFYKRKLERMDALIRGVFEEELRQARAVAEDTSREAGEVKEKTHRLEKDASHLKERYFLSLTNVVNFSLAVSRFITFMFLG